MDKFCGMQLFVSSAELGSFSRAAEHLGKTPSAVAKAIRLLEAELGARLFERTTRRMALTEAGMLYLESAREVLERMRESEEEIVQLHQSLQGTLRISGPLAFGRPFLNAACATFMEQHPGLRLQVDLSDDYVDLLDGRYDLALRLGHSDLPGLIARDIGESRAVLCAAPTYLERNGVPKHPDQLGSFEWLVYRHPALGDGWCMEKDDERHVIKHRGRLSSDNLELLLNACLAGQGSCPVHTGACCHICMTGGCKSYWVIITSTRKPWERVCLPSTQVPAARPERSTHSSSICVTICWNWTRWVDCHLKARLLPSYRAPGRSCIAAISPVPSPVR